MAFTLYFLVYLLLAFVNSENLTIIDENNKQLYPNNVTAQKQTLKCGITYRNLFQSTEYLTITYSTPFTVSINTYDENVRISGYSVSESLSNNVNSTKVLVFKQCTNRQFQSQVQYSIVFHIYPSEGEKFNKTIKAVSICNENTEQLQTVKSTISIFYGILWVSSVSFLPVFPAHNFLVLKLIILFYIVLSYCFELHYVILLIIMILVYRFSMKPHQIDASYQIMQDALLSERAYISMTLFYFFLLIIYLVNVIVHGEKTDYEIGVFQSLHLHILNGIRLLVHAYFFCKLVWINKFRDLFWWIVVIYCICVFIPAFSIESDSQYLNLLNPSIFLQKCGYKNVCLIFMMLPIALYIKRMDKNCQFISSMILIICLVFDFMLAFWLSLGLIFMWALFESYRLGFFGFIKYRWLQFDHIDPY